MNLDNTADVSDTGQAANEQPFAVAATDSVDAALDRFHVICNPLLRSLVAKLPIAFALLLLADWLIGRSAFAGDLFRLSGVLTVIIELLIVSALFDKVPKALRTIWSRGLVGQPRDGQSVATAFTGFLQQFEATLNGRYAWLVGVIFAIGGLIATYPIRYWITTGSSPYDHLDGWVGFYLWSGAILEIPLAYLLGLLTWRFGVIAFFVARLGEQFELKVQPRHPDRSGGLKPLGDLCLTNAFLILVPVFLLSGWVVAGTRTGMEVYGLLWAGLFRKWLVVLSIAAAFLFFRPLYRIHQQMEKQRWGIQRELDELSGKIEEILLKLRTEADTLAPKEGAQRLEELKFMEQVYQESSQVPTWPFDWNIILKFVAAEAVPILSLTGATGPLIKVVESLISLLSK